MSSETNTNIVPFSFESNQIRVVQDEKGEPLFVAKDVAEALGYDQTANGLKHCRHSSKMDELNRINNLAPATKWIPESDVYRMVLKSNLDSAHRFQDWVCEEVLPSIRKTGAYAHPQVPKPESLPPSYQQAASSLPAMMAAAEAFGFKGNQAAISANKAMLHFTGVNLLEAMGQSQLVAPDNDPLITVSDIAKRLKMTPRSVNPMLTGYGLQNAYRDHKDRLYYELTDEGQQYGVMVDTDKKHKSGVPVRQVKWRSSIIPFIEKRMLEDIIA